MLCVILFYFVNILCTGMYVFTWRWTSMTWVREDTKLITVGACGVHT